MADAHLDRIEKKLDALTDHVVALDGRVGGVEQGVAGLDRRLKQVDQRLTQVDERMVAGFARLEAKIDSHAKTQTHINSDLSDKHQDHERRIEKLEKERATASARSTDRPQRKRQ